MSVMSNCLVLLYNFDIIQHSIHCVSRKGKEVLHIRMIYGPTYPGLSLSYHTTPGQICPLENWSPRPPFKEEEEMRENLGLNMVMHFIVICILQYLCLTEQS